jgi:hypothetical protein
MLVSIQDNATKIVKFILTILTAQFDGTNFEAILASIGRSFYENFAVA